MLTCVPCTKEHVEQLRGKIRKEDQEELRLASGLPPGVSLSFSFQLSREAYVVLDGDAVLCAFGVVPHKTFKDVGIPWMICAQDFEHVPRQFARECRSHIRSLMAHFRVLKNSVYAGNTKAIRWLRWCGAHLFHEAVPRGPEGAPFIPFWFDTDNV